MDPQELIHLERLELGGGKQAVFMSKLQVEGQTQKKPFPETTAAHLTLRFFSFTIKLNISVLDDVRRHPPHRHVDAINRCIIDT